ncbi:alpha/beta hydrolase [Azospirillum sp. RWY-5-1]|uniref:Alpha/beta hydrolase n=2 Tax=Azospirillum oleiclasticum TaxID=2735135 RepID=A0ABX2T9Y4_9PROT|nr:alpha/beta hydrolase [Azospirillum oleiclasticum]NYZ13862.1 alpha/beta hydrolase [Azospirillum oleiclasticum]NYZ21134.1 alpha/beta hydrolase [Azospirillum oleiclasticum]
MLQTDNAPNHRIHGERFMIPSDTDGVQLQLINKRPVDPVEYSAERTLVMIHGATFPSASLFDVAVAGASFMDVLARHGYDVWAVDVRGYGGSTRLPEMSQPPDDNPPLIPARTAVRDLAAAVDFVRRKRGVGRVNLLGMSWGATVAGALAAEAGERFGKLVLVAPLWLSGTPLRFDSGGPIGAYRIVSPRAFEAAWRAAAPEQERAGLIPEGWFDAWAEATLATDAASSAAGTIRAPSGAVLDVRQHWTAGNPLYDPSAIANPVLLVCAEWDVDVRFDMAQDLFTRLTGARYKRLVEIGRATHMVLMEKNRGQAFDAVIQFLDEHTVPAG